jgi:hypothetical protein
MGHTSDPIESVINDGRAYYSLIMPTQNLTITDINVSDVTELSLPQGVYSNTELTEDTINLWNTVHLLLTYAQNLQDRVRNLELRVDAVEETLPKIIDAIKAINDTLHDIIESMTPKPDPWGVAGGIMNFLSTAVGMFFPIIGTAVGVLGQIVIGVGQLVDGDVANGILELTVGAFAAGLGLYKFGKRLNEKYKRTNDKVSTFDIRGKFKVGTYSKNTSMLPNQVYRDNPPSYDSIYPDTTTRVTPVSSKIKTSSVETSTDDLNRTIVTNNSTVMDTYQAHTFSEFEWMRITMESDAFTVSRPSNIVIESVRVQKYLGESPYSRISEENEVYFNGVINNVARRVAVSDSDFQNHFPGWPVGGTVMMSRLRDVYCDIGTGHSTLPVDRDIILPFLMAHGGEDSREVSQMTKYHGRSSPNRGAPWRMNVSEDSDSISILTHPMIYPTNPAIPYIMFGNSHKDAPASRDAVDRMIDFWQNNDLTAVLTDEPEKP